VLPGLLLEGGGALGEFRSRSRASRPTLAASIASRRQMASLQSSLAARDSEWAGGSHKIVTRTSLEIPTDRARVGVELREDVPVHYVNRL
jgi:hypothetical protein